MWDSLPLYAAGAGTTLQLLALALAIGLVVALPLSVLRSLPSGWAWRPVWLFTYVVRGTPLLVQLFLLYYGLAQFDAVRDFSLEVKADAIGMSGLLVKSTLIMRDNLEELNSRELSHIPVLLGGAALMLAEVHARWMCRSDSCLVWWLVWLTTWRSKLRTVLSVWTSSKLNMMRLGSWLLARIKSTHRCDSSPGKCSLEAVLKWVIALLPVKTVSPCAIAVAFNLS